MRRILVLMLTTIVGLCSSASGQKPTRQEPPQIETPAAFLERSEKMLYHPDQDSLESLTFRVNREYAAGKTLWTLSVEWNKGADAKVTGSVAKDAPIPAPMKAQVEASLPTIGKVFASEQLGRFLSYLQGVATATRDGTEEGFTRIRLSPKPGGQADFATKTLLFDDQDVLRKARTTLQDRRSTLTETYKWRPVELNAKYLVLESITANLTIQGMAITRITNYNYRKLEGYHLITSQTITTSGIPNAPVRNEDLHFISFVINGKQVGFR